MTEMEGIEHRRVQVNGINMHIAEKGQGPLILFLHGFPELWYSWRHQITALASLGYRAVAPDLRGFGDTDAPDYPTSYTCLHVVRDLIALLDAIAPDKDKVFVVGHDWDAYLAWFLCLFRPYRVKALVNMSVAFMPRNPQRKFIEYVKAVYGDDYYMCRFQLLAAEPGLGVEADHVIAARKFSFEKSIFPAGYILFNLPEEQNPFYNQKKGICFGLAGNKVG